MIGTDKKYKMPNGDILSEDEAMEEFGDDLQTYIAEGQIVEVEEEESVAQEEAAEEEVSGDALFVAPDGSELSEEEARAELGEAFDAAVTSGQLKKKAPALHPLPLLVPNQQPPMKPRWQRIMQPMLNIFKNRKMERNYKLAKSLFRILRLTKRTMLIICFLMATRFL